MSDTAELVDQPHSAHQLQAPAAPASLELESRARGATPVPVEALLNPIAHGISADQLYKLAVALSNSEIVPWALQGKPYNVFAVMLRGLELGITPMTAVCEINLIGGRTSLSSHLMVARVLASGKAKELRLVESTSDRAVVRVQRTEWADARDVEFTMDEAKKLGLDKPRGKNNAPSPYVTQPANMLRRRAYARACREHFPDVIIAYDPDEIEQGETPAPAGPSWSAPPPAATATPSPTTSAPVPPDVAARQEEVRRRAAGSSPPVDASHAPAAPPAVPAAVEPPPVDKTMAPSTLEDDLADPDEEMVLEIMAAIASAGDKAALQAAGARAKPLKERGDKGDQPAAAHYAEIRRAYNARSKELPK